MPAGALVTRPPPTTWTLSCLAVGAPPSSSVMVPILSASAIVAFVAPLKPSVNVSSDSTVVSPVTSTVTVRIVVPGENDSEPETGV